ncbi:MAG: TIGR02646 family protein, partial [Sphingobacteriales bacterium]|nr:TIGR02646 family protein [Sphingobacteriales bacterium]
NSYGTILLNSGLPSNDIWNEFYQNHTSIYQKLKQHLVDEQGSICAYCNQKISNDGNTQIEHLKDKSMFANQIFDYNNLVACCLGGEKDPKPRDLYCGAQKNRYYQQNGYSPLATYPLLASCETDIICQLNGQLKASNANIQQCIDKVVGLNVAQFTDPITGWRIHAISAVMYSNYIIYKLSLLQAKFKPTLPPKLIPITKTEAAQRYTIYNSTAKPYIPFCKAIADVLKKEFKL